MSNLLKNICLITFALVGPITLPAGGIQKSLNQYNLPNKTKEIILSSDTSLFSSPLINSKKLIVLAPGTLLTLLRDWKVNEREVWVRVQLATNKILDHPNRITKGWIKI